MFAPQSAANFRETECDAHTLRADSVASEKRHAYSLWRGPLSAPSGQMRSRVNTLRVDVPHQRPSHPFSIWHCCRNLGDWHIHSELQALGQIQIVSARNVPGATINAPGFRASPSHVRSAAPLVPNIPPAIHIARQGLRDTDQQDGDQNSKFRDSSASVVRVDCTHAFWHFRFVVFQLSDFQPETRQRSREATRRQTCGPPSPPSAPTRCRPATRPLPARARPIVAAYRHSTLEP
jgi:hypothetical protein